MNSIECLRRARVIVSSENPFFRAYDLTSSMDVCQRFRDSG